MISEDNPTLEYLLGAVNSAIKALYDELGTAGNNNLD